MARLCDLVLIRVDLTFRLESIVLFGGAELGYLVCCRVRILNKKFFCKTALLERFFAQFSETM